jgi:hypothetical protein
MQAAAPVFGFGAAAGASPFAGFGAAAAAGGTANPFGSAPGGGGAPLGTGFQFGSTPFGSATAPKKVVGEEGDDAGGDDGADAAQEECKAEFAALVELKEVDTVTGEEEELVLHEMCVLALPLFGAHSALPCAACWHVVRRGQPAVPLSLSLFPLHTFATLVVLSDFRRTALSPRRRGRGAARRRCTDSTWRRTSGRSVAWVSSSCWSTR